MSVITLAQAKEHLQIAHTAQDNVLPLYIDGVESFLAAHLGVGFASAVRTERLDGGSGFLLPNVRPVTVLTSVTDKISAQVIPAVLMGDGRFVRADATGNPLMRSEFYESGIGSGDWPQAALWTPGLRRFECVYTAGHAALPPMLKLAILTLVGRAYQARAGEAGANAGGASVNFGEFLRSDVMQMVKPFSRRRVIGIG